MKQISYWAPPLSLRLKSADQPRLAPSHALCHILLDFYQLLLRPALDTRLDEKGDGVVGDERT